MVQHQGSIDVYLASFAEIDDRYIKDRFREHPVPANSPKFTGNTNEAYIEAVDGKRFVVVVDIGKEFDAKGSARLWIECFIDGEFMSKQVVPHVQLREGVPRESTLQGRYTNEHTNLHLDRQLVKCGYAFSSLLTDENLTMSDNRVHQAVATYGTIVVKIWRCVNVGTGRPLTTIINNFPCDVIRGPRVSAKAVVEDNHVSHAVQHLMMGPKFRLGPRTETAHQRPVAKMHGSAGEVMTFTIRGRSRNALQKLGIIANDTTIRDTPVKREPSPERATTPGVMKVENDVVNIVDSEDEAEVVPRRIKVEEQDAQVQATQTPVVTKSATPSASGVHERTKKRKALEDEVEEIEDEERLLELRQRKRRLRRNLARLEEEDAE